MIFILFHGAFGSPEGNWFPKLKNKLESLGHTVLSPQFPIDDEKKLTKTGPKVIKLRQNLSNWLNTFDSFYKTIPKDEKLCFVGHSLGCLFILHIVARYNIKLDSAIFVGPFLDCLPTEVWPYTKIIESFQKKDFDSEVLKQFIPTSYVLYSDNDPYVSNKQSFEFAQLLNSSTIMLRSAGHMNMEVSLDEFSLVFDLCLTRLSLGFTHKYQSLNLKKTAFEYIFSHKEGGEINLEPKETYNKGIFNFQNIKDYGFATLFTGLKDLWDPHSQYMEYARTAAKRMKRFVRVILVEKLEDLDDPLWRGQMKADIASGIKIYLVLYDQIKDKVPEPDFGLWDNDYVAINKFNWKTRKITSFVFNSTNKMITTAQKWQKTILKGAFPVKDVPKDIKRFINSSSN